MKPECSNIRGRTSISEIEHWFDQALDRIKVLGEGTAETKDDEDLNSVYAQASFLLVYLEANFPDIDAQRLLVFRKKLFDRELLAGRRHAKERRIKPGASAMRRRLTGSIDRCISSAADDGLLRDAAAPVRHILREIDAERTALLETLGIEVAQGGPEAALARSLPQIQTVAVQRKLLQAWSNIAKHREAQLAEAMDGLVYHHWEHSERGGFRSPVERSLESCGIAITAARSFLDAYLESALKERVSFRTGFPEAVREDDMLRRLYLRLSDRETQHSATWQTIPLASLIGLVFPVVQRVFGFTFGETAASAPHALRYDVQNDGGYLGRLTIDLVPATSSDPTDGAGEKGEPTACDHLLPEARVTCIVSDTANCSLSFEAAHRFLHGMGHALIHLAVKPMCPSATGLDALPLERLEGLSHWLEGLLDHELAERHLASTPERKRALSAFRLAQQARLKNTRLEKAVAASLDLWVHDGRERGVRPGFRRFVGGVDASVSFERIVRFSTAPLFWSYPGMGFVYPWGAALGAMHQTAFSGDRCAIRSLRNYLHRERPSIMPDPQAEFCADAPVRGVTVPTDVPCLGTIG